MYAVIKVGGKQERVAPGDVIEVEFMKVDPGSAVEFEPILVVDDDGKAHHGKALSKAKVTAKLLGDKRGDKVRVFKYRPKSGYRRTQGHRQLMTLLEVDEVRLSPQVKATAPEDEAQAAPAKKPAAKKTAAKKTAAAKKPAAAKKSTAKKTAAKRTSRKST
jgi:large subunit ribosomal protein L21